MVTLSVKKKMIQGLKMEAENEYLVQPGERQLSVQTGNARAVV